MTLERMIVRSQEEDDTTHGLLADLSVEQLRNKQAAIIEALEACDNEAAKHYDALEDIRNNQTELLAQLQACGALLQEHNS